MDTSTSIITKNSEKFFELAITALIDNQIDVAINCFNQAAMHGNIKANGYHVYLHHEPNTQLARDIILCAERRV